MDLVEVYVDALLKYPPEITAESLMIAPLKVPPVISELSEHEIAFVHVQPFILLLPLGFISALNTALPYNSELP